MKNNRIYGGIWMAMISVMVFLTACTSGFEDANRPGGNLSQEDLNKDNYATGSFMYSSLSITARINALAS